MKFSVLLEYFRACRISVVTIFTILFLLASIASIGSNYWLSFWTKQSDVHTDDSEHKKYVFYGIFVLIGLVQCVFTLASDFVYLMMYYFATRMLHDNMLKSLLRSTMEFFESTPSGRIINRFSKDVEATERGIPESFKSFLRCLFHVLFTVLVILISTPLFFFALIPIIVVYIFVQVVLFRFKFQFYDKKSSKFLFIYLKRYFVASMRQLKRMESASKSPIFSHFGETVNGVSTIRAYSAQKRFIRIMERHVDENLLYYFPNNISNRWLALRLEFVRLRLFKFTF